MRLFLAVVGCLLYAGTASADHDPNPRVVANLSYQLADDGEELAWQARRIGQYNISYSADDLHMEASDLYYLARDIRSKEMFDHRLREAFFSVKNTYLNLQRFFPHRDKGAEKDHRLERWFDNLRYSYMALCREILGPPTVDNKELFDHRCDS